MVFVYRLARVAARKTDAGNCRRPTESHSPFAKIGHFCPQVDFRCHKYQFKRKLRGSKKHALFVGFSHKVLAASFLAFRTERLLLLQWRSLYDADSIQSVGSGVRRREREGRTVVTVKASQKIFTDSEVATLTGICVDHLHNFAKGRHLGFIARAAEAAGLQTDPWLFTLSDLMVPVTLFPPCPPQTCPKSKRISALPGKPRALFFSGR